MGVPALIVFGQDESGALQQIFRLEASSEESVIRPFAFATVAPTSRLPAMAKTDERRGGGQWAIDGEMEGPWVDGW